MSHYSNDLFITHTSTEHSLMQNTCQPSNTFTLLSFLLPQIGHLGLCEDMTEGAHSYAVREARIPVHVGGAPPHSLTCLMERYQHPSSSDENVIN